MPIMDPNNNGIKYAQNLLSDNRKTQTLLDHVRPTQDLKAYPCYQTAANEGF